jgi:dATP pyrophosphohydrolase
MRSVQPARAKSTKPEQPGSSIWIQMDRAPFQVLILPFRRGTDGALEYAIFRRADMDVWQGLAGGGEDDETPLQAAVRELREEAGITAGVMIQLSAVGSVAVEHFSERASWDSAQRTIPEYAFGLDATNFELSLSSEHCECVWLPLDEALTRLEWDSNRNALRELHHRLVAGDDETRGR